jgi:hypothetical protein
MNASVGTSQFLAKNFFKKIEETREESGGFSGVPLRK